MANPINADFLVHPNAESSQNPEVRPNYTIDFLCRLIPNEFNGNRFELGQFIANCNNACELASDSQQIPLLYFILSRISGRAKEQLAQQQFRCWNDLKEKLKILYQDKKHYVQIMEELNNCKQFHNESVSAFFQRLEVLNSRALSAAQQNNSNANELPGKLKTINEIALNRFIFHSNPAISQMLRWKEFETLNAAYSSALTEERALNINKNIRTRYCKNCKNNDHDTSHCRLQRTNRYSQNQEVNFVQNKKRDFNKKEQIICHYCKKIGHRLNDCRKREYNNRIKNQNFENKNSFNKFSKNYQGNRSNNLNDEDKVHLNYQQSPAENIALEDQVSQIQMFKN